MRIDAFYNFIVYILRKERNGFVSIADFNIICPRAQLDVYNDYYDFYAVNQKLHDSLSPFKVYYNFTPSTSPVGVITLPADYGHLLYGNTVVSGSLKNINFVNEDEWINANNSVLRAVSINYPLGINNAGTIQLAPAQGQTGTIVYLKIPDAPVYSFFLSGRTITYDAGSSVQLGFTDIYQNKIAAACLKYFGVNLSDQEVQAYAMSFDKKSS